MTILDTIKHTLVEYVHPFLDSHWNQQKEHPVGSLGTAIFLIDTVAKRTPAIGIPKPPTPLEILNGSYLNQQKVYKIAETSLVGTTGMGAVTTLLLLITGLPAISVVTGLLSVGTLAGAFIAHEAAASSSLTESIAELRGNMRTMRQDHTRQIALYNFNNTVLRTHIENLSVQNNALRNNIEALTEQNNALRANIENMQAQVSQFALQNQHYRAIASDFRGYIEQFRSGAAHDREEFATRLENFTQQISASQELWRNFSNETNIFRENYAVQLGQLRDLIAQITDPRGTLVRLEEHRMINEHIQNAVARLEQHQRDLANLDAQIAIRDAQLRERDQLLVQLRSAHHEILASYQHQTTTLGHRNNLLEREINRISTLIDRHFDTTMDLDVNIPVPANHVLAIRKAPNWNENIRFTPSHTGWTGRAPIGKEFKFVIISPHGGLQWERGSNRMFVNPRLGQHEMNIRQPVF